MGITIHTAVALVILAAVSYPQWKALPQEGSKALWYRFNGGGVVVGAVGMLHFYTAIKGTPLNRVMPVAFTSPLFGALIGLAFGGEPITFNIGLGMAWTVGGIALLTFG